MDHAVAVVPEQPVQVLQADQEQLAVGDAHLRGLEVVENGEDQLALAHQVPHLIRLFALLAVDEEGEDLHEPGQGGVDLASILGQLLEGILEEL